MPKNWYCAKISTAYIKSQNLLDSRNLKWVKYDGRRYTSSWQLIPREKRDLFDITMQKSSRARYVDETFFLTRRLRPFISTIRSVTRKSTYEALERFIFLNSFFQAYRSVDATCTQGKERLKIFEGKVTCRPRRMTARKMVLSVTKGQR